MGKLEENLQTEIKGRFESKGYQLGQFKFSSEMEVEVSARGLLSLEARAF